VKRIVRLLVLVNSAPGFTEPHEVANGASELFLEVFGERGAHARSAFGAAQIPFGSCVEIEIIVEVSDSDSECQAGSRQVGLCAYSDNDLQAPVKRFGRDMTKQGVLMLILNDQHEHLGQSIAYARSNSVVPPWSK
jgi:hypothetical protein